MAIVLATAESSFPELGLDGSVESLVWLLDSQKKLLHSQADQLHRVVVTHCKLTGVNPLSQEMAAGALSIKMGKKPRDLLNPKAVKYMQSVFAIKDIIGKKETREISALFGVTVTQVRDFFAGQRSKVRKLVLLAREKAARLDVLQAANDRLANPDATSLLGNDAVLKIDESTQVPANEESVAVCSVDAKPIQMAFSSSSSHEEIVPGVDEDDKKFLGNIFNLMRKEGTFSGQVKLMEWILQINNSAVLIWFSAKGSIMILATWLSQAAIEEQTTVLNVILKVLCHLPLHKALPKEVSAVLQTVNKLRFYRTADISNRARILLSRWSKMLVRIQSQKYPSALNSNNDVQKEIIRKQRINEILSDEFWRSKIGIPENILPLAENGGNDSKPIPRLAQKLLTTSCDSYSRKQPQCASIRIKERRKVRLVEQLDQKPSVRIALVGRAAPINHSRPISADDIQKAKIRAMFMQHKYGKPDPASNENKTIEEHNEGLTTLLQSKNISPAPSIMQPAPVNREEEKPAKVVPGNQLKPTEAPRVDLSEMLKANRVQWRTPPEMKIDSSWRVGEAENSKELLVQAQRTRREKETFYLPPSQIPPNPKDPWDVEMDFDDSLTPEIPIEQPPDADIADDSADEAEKSTVGDVPAQPIAAPSIIADAPVPVPAPTVASSGIAATPDLELLAVLLKNPELVFALTSGQGKNLSNNERVALLDMIKHSNALLADGANGTASGVSLERSRESAPVSLPSPTPPSDAERMTGWRSTFPAMAGAPLPPPQLSVAVLRSFPAQTAQSNTFISQRPILSLPQPAPSSGYPAQERANFEASLRRDAGALNPISIHMLPPPPSFPPQPQPPMISEPSAYMFPPNPASWEWRDADNIERRDTMAEFSARRPNAAEIPPQNPRFGASESTYNNPYPRHHAGSQSSESWSPEDSPVRSSELRHGRDRSYDGPRSGRGWNRREEWPKQRTGHRDQYRSGGRGGGRGGGRWRHRDRDRRR
ncbi:Homeobox protein LUMINIDEPENDENS [Platanthera zijinensis]|uniref:Homeobox protein LUMINIDEPENDENS n=1 Tax=Platanthera zijinensis TaxID=2320716 RepID=A0AAP0B648_9ASPA